MKLYWSDIAEADLNDIYDYIARDVPYYAELFVDRLLEATDKLENLINFIYTARLKQR